jgi:hypothetical protein
LRLLAGMSKHNNVNPGQYKVAGRERPGQDIPEPERAPGVEPDQAAQERWDKRQKERQNENAD